MRAAFLCKRCDEKSAHNCEILVKNDRKCGIMFIMSTAKGKGIFMGSNHMEENEQAVLFQKEGKGKVYVSGRSGSGKTTLLLKRLHFLKEEGISFSTC